MAKRKRLSAPDFASTAPGPATAGPATAMPATLETKSGLTPPPSQPPSRHSPAASAPIADVAGQSARQAAFEKVMGEMEAAQSEGRFITKIPLAAIDADHLIRDRVILDPAEMAALEASIAVRGQKTPIELVAKEGGGYGLISGWRRLNALRSLARAPDGPQTALAIVRSLANASEAYTAMVEENEIRVGLTYFERASIVLRALEEGVFEHEKHALNALFATASRAKRSKVKSFLPVVAAVGGLLRHPGVLTERLGLALAARLAEEEGFAAVLRAALAGEAPRSAEEETALLQEALKPSSPSVSPSVSPSLSPAPAPTPAPSERARDAQADTPAGAHAEAHAGAQIDIARSTGRMVLKGGALTPAMMDAIETLIRDWRE